MKWEWSNLDPLVGGNWFFVPKVEEVFVIKGKVKRKKKHCPEILYLVSA